MSVDRRRFVAYFAGTGLVSTLFPGALWAIVQQQQQNRITKEMIQQAEQLAGLEFTDEERQAMVAGVNGNLRSYEQLRTVPLPNSVPPAIQFDPVLPGMVLPSVRRPKRYSSAGAVVAPKNIEQVAFWPVLRLAALVRTRQVLPVALTEMYLDRFARHPLGCQGSAGNQADSHDVGLQAVREPGDRGGRGGRAAVGHGRCDPDRQADIGRFSAGRSLVRRHDPQSVASRARCERLLRGTGCRDCGRPGWLLHRHRDAGLDRLACDTKRGHGSPPDIRPRPTHWCHV